MPDHNFHISGLKGLGKAIFAAKQANHREDQKLTIIGKNRESAASLLRDLKFLLGPEKSETDLLYLPHADSNPYQASTPDPHIQKERLATLFKLASGFEYKILVTTPTALLTKTCDLKTFQDKAYQVELQEEIDRDGLLGFLTDTGYHQVNKVEDPGTFALRGSIIDIFWPGKKEPIRLDLFGDLIDRLYYFNPSNQRKTKDIKEFAFGPVREYFFSNNSFDTDKIENKLRNLADDIELPTKKLNEILEQIDNEMPFFGIDALLPAFHENLTSPLELIKSLGPNNTFIFDDYSEILQNISKRQKAYKNLYKNAFEAKKLVFKPEDYLLDKKLAESLFESFKSFNIAVFSGNPLEPALLANHASRDLAAIRDDKFHTEATNHIRKEIISNQATDKSQDQNSQIYQPLAAYLKQNLSDHIKTYIPLSSLGSAQHLKESLDSYNLHTQILKAEPNLLALQQFSKSTHAFLFIPKTEPPETGVKFLESNNKFCIISEDDIFGKKTRRSLTSGKSTGFKTTLSDLNEGDFVVHAEHGIGKFFGLKKIKVRGIEQDYALILYSKDDKLFLPVQHINLIQPYTGMGASEPRRDKLGGTAWASKKTKVKAAVLAMAQDLLILYAKREILKRDKFAAPTEEYWDFEAQFEFEPTADQHKAIDDVLSDMQSERPMDRLICGDVGYGKTEVAMRAAMMALQSGKQVAVLSPTTVLTQQHTKTFTDRFKNTPAIIDSVSRFKSKKEISKALAKTAEGRIDILVGTHRLLSSDVNFKDLGLVIVDEEQRFGIKAKEALKKLKTKSDIITMSATPIPRTMQMSFLGIRDLSIIETPPVDRLAIRTSIMQHDDAVIREGILRELNRGGQVYFVHNKVATIQAQKEYLQNLIPEAKIDIGHGQMPEKELEDVMVRFVNQEFNVFVCSTIIETGIDVPTANTMFINNADDLGLAQLYQLRGRIGRSKERAFAYLVIPTSQENLTPVAKRRLEVIHEFSELGAGFKIAQHDLELRGAGDLLGKTQHGHVASVGYDLYVDLLKEAVAELKGHSDLTLAHSVDPDVNLPIKALIPEDYAVDLHERMGFYQKLATAENPKAIYDVLGEIEDLLGLAPDEVNNLAEIMIIKYHLKKLAARNLVVPDFDQNTQSPTIIISLLQPEKIKLKSKIWRQSNKNQKIYYEPSLEVWEKNKQNLTQLCKSAIKELALG